MIRQLVAFLVPSAEVLFALEAFALVAFVLEAFALVAFVLEAFVLEAFALVVLVLVALDRSLTRVESFLVAFAHAAAVSLVHLGSRDRLNSCFAFYATCHCGQTVLAVRPEASG